MFSDSSFYDIASLAKPLVTAPLALDLLDLEQDARPQLALSAWPTPLTPRALLSHSASLPPWRPYTDEALADLLRPMEGHDLLRAGPSGTALYSDVGYRLLAELIEARTGLDWMELGQAFTGLCPCPWPVDPPALPPGPDREAWSLATDRLFPEPKPGMPHDANARAGMKGHAGFGGSPHTLFRWVQSWADLGYAQRMAVELAKTAQGQVWGMGLHRASSYWIEVLEAYPFPRPGLTLLLQSTLDSPPEQRVAQGASSRVEPLHDSLVLPDGQNEASWWMHLAFTGPALFVRPADGCVILLLLRRLDGKSPWIDATALAEARKKLLSWTLMS